MYQRLLRSSASLFILFIILIAGTACQAEKKSSVNTRLSSGEMAPLPTTTVVWHPKTKPLIVEPDTVFFLNPDVQKNISPEEGGLRAGNSAGGQLPFEDRTYSDVGTVTRAVDIVPGAYGTAGPRAVASAVDRYGTLTHFFNWELDPTEFTFEYLLQLPEGIQYGDTNLGNYFIPVQLGETNAVAIQFNGKDSTNPAGYATVQYINGQENTTTAFRVSLPATLAIRGRQWNHFALTLKNGVLTLYVNEKAIGTKSGVVPFSQLGGNITILGQSVVGGRAENKGIRVCAVRVSRYARVPGRNTIPVTNVLALNPSVVTTPLNKGVGGLVQSNYGLDAKRQALFAPITPAVRVSKPALSAIIKAGGMDVTHPVAGKSGQFSYDFQVVKRSIDAIVSGGTRIIYCDFNGTPAILGGTVPDPPANSKNTLVSSPESTVAPASNLLPKWGAISGDIAYWLTKTYPKVKFYFAPWNEPQGNNDTMGSLKVPVGDPGYLQTGTPDAKKLDCFLKLYQAMTTGIRAAVPDANVGGGDLDNSQTLSEWIQGLIRYAKQNNLPLNFVSIHDYNDLPGVAEVLQSQIARWSTATGLIHTPSLIVSEGCWGFYHAWNSNWVYKGSSTKSPPYPYPDSIQHNHDAAFGGAWLGAKLIEYQNAGVLLGTNWTSEGMLSRTGADNMGALLDFAPDGTGGHISALYNVLLEWSQMGQSIVSSHYTGLNVLRTLATKNKAGNTQILIAYPRWRRGEADANTLQRVTITGLNPGDTVMMRRMDEKSANYMDAGAKRESLVEELAGLVRSDGSFTTPALLPRSVVLFETKPSPNFTVRLVYPGAPDVLPVRIGSSVE